jgi:RNA polymerase sigma-70 factor (ECF subfamily)
LQRYGEFTALSEALRTLKPEDQTLIALRFFEEKSFSEIAEIVGKRVGAITMRTSRALTKLQTELERRGISHERFGEEPFRAGQTGYGRSDLPAKSAT